MLAPHLQRAVQINLKLARAELNHKASVATLDHLDDGILFVDLDTNVNFVNKAAEQFFANGDLRQREALHAGSSNETAGTSCGHCEVLHKRNSASTWRLRFSATTRDGRLFHCWSRHCRWRTRFYLMPSQPMAVIFVNDPDKVSRPTVLHLREKFGMTPAEARFARRSQKEMEFRRPPIGFLFRLRPPEHTCRASSTKLEHDAKRNWCAC